MTTIFDVASDTMVERLEPPANQRSLSALREWHRVLVESVRARAPDLTQRQVAVLLTIYLETPPHTVRGLAAHLDISKPAITRALDRLSQLGLVRRRRDTADRRNVLLDRTDRGETFLRGFAAQVRAAERGRAA